MDTLTLEDIRWILEHFDKGSLDSQLITKLMNEFSNYGKSVDDSYNYYANYDYGYNERMVNNEHFYI